MNRTLDELEHVVWGEPNFDSYLVTTCHALRRKPLKDFTTEDLRIMIGQNNSLVYLLPLAIDVLKQEPLASGDYYEGDLLNACLSCELAEIKEWRNFAIELEEIADRALKTLARSRESKVDEEIRRDVRWGFERVGRLLRGEN